MLRCMTGFGKAILKGQDKNIYIEIKGFNHKFLEISFNLANGYTYLEPIFKKEIAKKIKRGRITVCLEISGLKSARVLVNEELISQYLRLLRQIKSNFSLKEDISLNTLINLPGVLSMNIEREDKKLEPKIKECFHSAFDEFLKSRESLGRKIYKEFKTRCKLIKEMISDLENRSNKVIKEKAERIDNPEERSNFLNNRDISEELHLLKFLIMKLEKKLEADSPIGKEIDFIVQEMQREINTLSAKSFDSGVISYSIKIKTQIERIREQVQNVE